MGGEESLVITLKKNFVQIVFFVKNRSLIFLFKTWRKNMVNKYFKKAVAVCVAAIVLEGTASAQIYECCYNDCSYDCYSGNDCCNYASLKPAQPFDCGFYFGGEWLYWTVDVSDLDYAFDNSNGFDVGRDDGAAKLRFLDYNWYSGFRAYLGYRWGCDGWDIRVIYTRWCKDNEKDSVKLGTTSSSSDHIKPTLWSPAFGNDRANKAKIEGNIRYQVADALLSRPYCVSRTLITRPFFGFRGIRLDQEIDVTYSGGRDFVNADGTVEWESEYMGYGLHAGMEWNLNFCKWFGFYASAAGSIVTGETDDYVVQEGPEGTSGSSITKANINIEEEQWVSLNGYQLSAGFSFEYCFCNCVYSILNLGYEFTHWNNVPQVRRFVDGIQEGVNVPAARGCLAFHGPVVRLELHF